LRGENFSRINAAELLTVLMQTMDRQTIIMQRVHHVLLVAFNLLMLSRVIGCTVLVTMAQIACVHPHLYDDFHKLSASLDDWCYSGCYSGCYGGSYRGVTRGVTEAVIRVFPRGATVNSATSM